MELELEGKTVLVTGASRGIGRAIAEGLYNEGCRVAINARNTDDLNIALTKMPGSVVVSGDVTNPDEAQRVIDTAVAQLGKLDILVCNVGSGRSVPPGEETYSEWQRVFALNLWSTTNTVEAAREALSLSKGVIICISSICGIEVIPGAPVTYSAAKAALHAYVRGISHPLSKQGIRINAISPGNIYFPGGSWDEKIRVDSRKVEQIIEATVPMNRFGTVDEITDATLFLCSARASFMTGSCLVIDGGQTMSVA